MERDDYTCEAVKPSNISTHTLTWSVTTVRTAMGAVMTISTHTLTWSVTGARMDGDNNDGYFNSHAHVERDKRDFDGKLCTTNFNSHAHVERDTLNNIPAEQAANFNSHAHVERDERRVKIIENKVISTHTLTWSVTQKSRRI